MVVKGQRSQPSNSILVEIHERIGSVWFYSEMAACGGGDDADLFTLRPQTPRRKYSALNVFTAESSCVCSH